MSGLYEQPKRSIPVLRSLTDPVWIADWILRVAPRASAETYDVLWKYLAARGVRPDVINRAMQLANRWRPLAVTAVPPRRQQQAPTMGPAPAFDLQRLKWRAQLLDARFQTAQRSGDTKAMADNAKALAELLRALGKMGRDRARMAQVRAEILRNAPNIARVIRTVGPRHPMPRPRGGGGRPWFSPPPAPRPAR